VNFNTSAASGALLNDQIIGSQHAIEDGRAGLMKFPFRMWTWNAGDGVITAQGTYRTYQFDNKLIMLAKPAPKVISERAKEFPFGQRKLPAQEIKSVQCTAALFNFEDTVAEWEIFVDDKRLESLPATAKSGQVITIRDGVIYLAIHPLPTDDLGRNADNTLEAGQPQSNHEFTNIQPALLIHSNFYRKDAVISQDALAKLKDASYGFIVEMGDEKEYGSFEKFQTRIREAKLSGNKGDEDYQSGAVVQRGNLYPELPLLLQTFPKQKIYIAANILPDYLPYNFREPGVVKIVAAGICSMSRWPVKDSREIDIKYTPFGNQYRSEPEKKHPLASLLFVSGTKEKPKVTLNEKDITGDMKARKQGDAEGWLVPLGQGFPKDDEISERLKATAALETASRYFSLTLTLSCPF